MKEKGVKTVTIETLDKLKPVIFDLSRKVTQKLRDCHFCSIRMEASEAKSAVALNGDPVNADSNWEISLGIHVIAGDKMRASGYAGLHLGFGDLKSFNKIVEGEIQTSYERALSSARVKMDLKNKFGGLAQSITSTLLASVEIHQDFVMIPFEKDPREVPLEKFVHEVVDLSKDVRLMEGVIANQQYLYGALIRKIFVSSEGTCIDQIFPLTQLLSVAVTCPDGSQRSIYYDCLGNLAGWEVIQGKNIFNQTGYAFAAGLARRAVRLSHAPILPSSDKEVPVVFDGHYGALNIHEIVGHPVELDRVLKMETHYAGRSRFLKSFENHQIGQRVASSLVTAFSDPEIPGYGHFKYDDEGVKAKKVVHIDKGILTADFLNSRETAHIMQMKGFNVEPNGAVRAADPIYVPLVRMTNTCFAPGDRNPEEIIKEIDHGFYFKWARIPSISESRENFRISAEETWEIKNGRLVELYRDGSISADSESFLKNIDAVGNDFVNYPIFNCGKGQPMQAMRVGNGSPTIRSRAKVVGGHMKG